MSNVRVYLERDPPEMLYHYTTQIGLLGILEKKQIWATHTQYLNDQQEFRHAIAIVKDELFQMQLVNRTGIIGERIR